MEIYSQFSVKEHIVLPVAISNSSLPRWEKSIHRFWKTGSFLNIIPLQYEFTFNRLSPSKFVPRGLIWWIIIFLYFLDILYLLHISKTVTLTSVTEEEFVNFNIHFISRMLAGHFIFHLSHNIEDFSKFYAILVQLGKQCDVSSVKGFGFIIQAANIFSHVQPIFPLLLHLQSRHSARYWPSIYLKREIYDNFFFATIYALNDLIYSYVAIFGTIAIILPVFCYTIFSIVCIKQLR